MYQPEIDRAKQMEMEILKEKQKQSSTNLALMKRARRGALDDDISIAEYSQSDQSSPRINFNPRKFKPNTMVPHNPPKREPKHVDWLLEQRQKRAEAVKRSGKSLSVDWAGPIA
jgi:hypothetical protein